MRRLTQQPDTLVHSLIYRGCGESMAIWRVEGRMVIAMSCAGARRRRRTGPVAKYQLVAYPEVAKKSGTPAFCTNESDVINLARSGSALECLRAGTELSEDEVNDPQ